MKNFLITALLIVTLVSVAPITHAEAGDATDRGYTTSGATNAGNISYTPLEPLLPNAPANVTSDFGAYLGLVFKVLLSLGALLAVGRLVVGGIMYMTSEVTETKGDAKRWMTSSIYGLLLLAGSWLILYTINPQLLNFSLNVKKGTSSFIPTPTPTQSNGQATLEAANQVTPIAPGDTTKAKSASKECEDAGGKMLFLPPDENGIQQARCLKF